MHPGNDRDRFGGSAQRRSRRRIIRTGGPQRRSINLSKRNPDVAGPARFDELRAKARVLEMSPTDPANRARVMLRRRLCLAPPQRPE